MEHLCFSFVNDYTLPMTQNLNLNDDALARAPTQARSRQRFERVIAAADTLLKEQGLSGFSIPALAERLGFSRRSIYLFFPTPYAVLNEVTRRYIKGLERYLSQMMGNIDEATIEQIIAQMTYAAADFHNQHPVARLLILGGAVTDRSYRAQEMNTLHLGQMARRILEQHGFKIPSSPPDIPTVAIELGTACFRLSHASYGEITDTYKVEAAHVMLLYLSDALELSRPLNRQQLEQWLHASPRNVLPTSAIPVIANAD